MIIFFKLSSVRRTQPIYIGSNFFHYPCHYPYPTILHGKKYQQHYVPFFRSSRTSVRSTFGRYPVTRSVLHPAWEVSYFRFCTGNLHLHGSGYRIYATTTYNCFTQMSFLAPNVLFQFIFARNKEISCIIINMQNMQDTKTVLVYKRALKKHLAYIY